MLPDIRAVIAAMVAAIGLLLISFALVATYRVAQQHQTGSLQEDLAKRGRTALPALSGERQILAIETPGPHLTVPAEAGRPTEIVPAAETVSAPRVSEPEPLPVAAVPPPIETPKPPIGGPVAARPESSRNAAAENPSRIDSRQLQRAAAEKARKARAARIARERKAALRHAAQARRAKQSAAPSSNNFGSPFGGTFTRPTGQ